MSRKWSPTHLALSTWFSYVRLCSSISCWIHCSHCSWWFLNSSLNILTAVIVIAMFKVEHRNTSLPQTPHTDANCPRSLRSSSAPLLAQPSRRTDFAARGFRYSAPAVWNSLPRTVLDNSSLTGLKLTCFTWLIMTDNDWRDLTSSATASEVTTFYGGREMCVLLLLLFLNTPTAVHYHNSTELFHVVVDGLAFKHYCVFLLIDPQPCLFSWFM